MAVRRRATKEIIAHWPELIRQNGSAAESRRNSNMNFKMLIVILLLSLSATAQTNKPSRKMAVTFDDLPYVAARQSPHLPKPPRATKENLRLLHTHHIPAHAF